MRDRSSLYSSSYELIKHYEDKIVKTESGFLTDVIQVDAYYTVVMALTNDGNVWAWGRNYDGLFGNNNKISSDVAIQIGLTNVKRLSNSQWHTIVAKDDGSLSYLTWGNNHNGVLGIDSTENVFYLTPQEVQNIP